MNRPSPDDMKAMWVVDYVTELKMKNKDEFRELYNKAKEDVVRLSRENKELKEKLEHYENTKAIQESNNASRWKPWCMSCVDRELNHFSL